MTKTSEELKMNQYDSVRLIKPYRGMKVGTRGAIVEKYREDAFEVEFFDENHKTIDVCPVYAEYLELVVAYVPKK